MTSKSPKYFSRVVRNGTISVRSQIFHPIDGPVYDGRLDGLKMMFKFALRSNSLLEMWGLEMQFVSEAEALSEVSVSNINKTHYPWVHWHTK